MRIYRPSRNHADDRGMIRDLIDQRIDTVTLIHTVEGGVRGNHYHEMTVQWTYVLKGKLEVTNGLQTEVAEPGVLVSHPPGDPHAWRALVDTDCLVFTRGPRSGGGYEGDTHDLTEPLL
jgi:quercetin dioxygenase-like cupin family protein